MNSDCFTFEGGFFLYFEAEIIILPMNVKDEWPYVCFLFFQTLPKRWQASSTRQHMNHNNCFYNYTVNSANNRDVLEWETDEFHELSGRSVPPPTLRVCGYFYCDVAVCSAAELSSCCCWWNLRIFVDELSERSCGLYLKGFCLSADVVETSTKMDFKSFYEFLCVLEKKWMDTVFYYTKSLLANLSYIIRIWVAKLGI